MIRNLQVWWFYLVDLDKTANQIRTAVSHIVFEAQ